MPQLCEAMASGGSWVECEAACLEALPEYPCSSTCSQ